MVALAAVLVCSTVAVAPAFGQTVDTTPSTEPTTTPTTAPTTVPTTGPTTGSTTTRPGPTTSRPGTTRPGATTTTTAPPGTTTTISAPPKPGTSPAGDPAAAGDATSDAVPGAGIVVPPAPKAGSPVGGPQAAQIVVRELKAARDGLARAEAAHRDAVARVAEVESRQRALVRKVARLRGGDREAVEHYAASKTAMAGQTADAYIRSFSGADPQASILISRSPNDYGQRRLYLASLLESMRNSVDEFNQARRSVRAELAATGDEASRLSLELIAANAAEKSTAIALLTAGFAVQVFAAGSQIFVSGFVFPVADPHDFIDSYGAPRMMGTASAHFHEGTDIMAAAGTPLFACERGVISKMGSNGLGGTIVWLKGQSGTSYYYAHLSAYAPGLTQGQVVEPGTTIGFVGNTGNAQYTAAHLHFEVHPDGGPAINPYPILKVVDDLAHGRPVTTATTIPS